MVFGMVRRNNDVLQDKTGLLIGIVLVMADYSQHQRAVDRTATHHLKTYYTFILFSDIHVVNLRGRGKICP